MECVLRNSVQSEANFAELELLQAIERNEIKRPLIEVDFAEANGKFKKIYRTCRILKCRTGLQMLFCETCGVRH